MRATIIHNASAGARIKWGGVERARKTFLGRGWQVQVIETRGPGSATGIAREAAERGEDVVIVAGGDGTINEAIQALAGTSTALGVLPMGSVNVWAREIGLSLFPPNAAVALAEGAERRVDLGKIEGRYFLLMAGIGFDAAVAEMVTPRLKRTLGAGSYALMALCLLRRYRGTNMIVEMDEETLRCKASLVVVGNTRLYGGALSLTPGAFADDGLFDVSIYPTRRAWEGLRHLPSVVLRRRSRSGAQYFRTAALHIQASSALPVQIDGEYIGTPRLHVTLEPRALRVIVPRDSPLALTGDDAARCL